MAKIGSSQKPTSPLGGRRIGSSAALTDGSANLPIDDAPAAATASSQTTLAQRLEAATLAGPLTAVPPTYADGQDWETILSDDVFARLYLAAPLHAQITDEQVATNKAVLAGFWQSKLNRFITGDRDIEDTYRPGTVNKAQQQLETATAALADAAGRTACFAQLEARRREAAEKRLDAYLRPQLVNKIMRPEAIELAVKEGVASGLTRTEAEQYTPAYLRRANFAPITSVSQSANLLQATWTEGGLPLADQPYTIVLGQKVYSLAEAGQALYTALSSSTERDKAARNLDSTDYLENIAKDLKENDVQLDLREILQDRTLNQAQRRMKALYLLGPGLPFHADGVVDAFVNPTQLLSRTATSAIDFSTAEAAFTAGLLPIWMRAAVTAEVKDALPATNTALDFRRFLHRAVPTFPLWIGSEAFTSPTHLAAYIRRDEHTWKMVYGSLAAGNLSPWLHTMGQADVLERQAQLADALLGPGLEPNSEPGRLLAVQALLEALDPQTPVPSLDASLRVVDLTGLSGETQAQRVLTLTNTTGGAVRVFLVLEPQLDGVSFLPSELFFDQRAPGQQLAVTLTGNPTLMPRNGEHPAKLTIRTAYVAGSVPVKAGAVFPQKEVLQFVVGSALALAAVFGGVRYLLGFMLGDGHYKAMVKRGELLPLDRAMDAGHSPVLLVALLLLGGLLFAFVRVLAKLAKPQPTP